MEKSQYNLCIEVLKRMDKAGALDELILIGSWCIPFYRKYFENIKYPVTIRTRDIDFLIPSPHRIHIEADIPGLLKDLGFIIGFKGSKGYIKLEHPDLVIEFLTPERGRGTDKPIQMPKLRINAQGLRFLTFLTDNTIKVEVEEINLVLPHPINFALHKLIIFQRRSNPEKAAKDQETAIRILKALIQKGESQMIHKIFMTAPVKWRKKIVTGAKKSDEPVILSLFQ